MLFNSWQYLIFFVCVVSLYYILPHRHRWKLLLPASYYFYMCWKAEYVFLILVSTLIDYFAGLRMGASEDKLHRRMYLVMSLCTNLGLLFAFKYFNFFNESVRVLFDRFDIFYQVPAFDVLLPVGISFYTFQTLSYTIDVYRGDREPERHLGIFALYVAFFPQLVAGPIERSTHLLPQFFKEHKPEFHNFIEGLKLIIWGLFKKVVIADRLAVIVDQVYSQPTEFQGWPLILATYCFGIQIFCDFSGYSDIAIGSARVLGFRLMDNFRAPYFAQSINDFWRRWHISLTTWFRDYLYIPLGGNQVGWVRWYFNILVVFLISGLWHGANWTFVVWGMLHVFYYFCSKWSATLRKSLAEIIGLENYPILHRVIRVVITFNLVSFAWIFFRANSLAEAIYIAQHIFSGWATDYPVNIVPMTQAVVLIICLLPVFVKFVFQWLNSQDNKLWRQVFYAVVINFIIFFGIKSNEAFIYFQF